jgi:DNA-binding MarR family transcriptional regulator
MPERISAEELETVAELRVSIRRFLAVSAEVTRAHGLTPAYYDLLALLHRPNGRSDLTASAIADQLSLSRSATTELLTRAANAGLITRVGDHSDMRIKHLVPTREGTARFRATVKDLRNERHRLLALLQTAAGLAATLSTVNF